MSAGSSGVPTDFPVNRSMASRAMKQPISHLDPPSPSPSISDTNTSQVTPSGETLLAKTIENKLGNLCRFVQPFIKEGMERKFNLLVKELKDPINQLEMNASSLKRSNACLQIEVAQYRKSLGTISEDVKQNTTLIKTMMDKVQKLDQTRPLTYAQRARLGNTNNLEHQSNHQTIRTKNNIIIKKRNPQDSKLEINRALRETLRPDVLQVQINKIRNLSNDTILIECPDQSNCDKIKHYIDQNEKCDIIAQEERKKYPTLLIKKVQRTLSDHQIIQSIIYQNFKQYFDTISQNEHPQLIKIVFKRNLSQEFMDVVIRVHPTLYKQILTSQRLFIDYSAVKVLPFTLITQCYKCMAYGHTSKYCKSDRSYCGHCGNEHDYKNCPNKTKEEHLKCINCSKSAKKNGDHTTRHSAISPQCPVRSMMIQRQIDRTDYGAM